ncbi:tcdB toxin N-terminal helical domain protein, partial [Escherichia coli 95.0183]
PIL